MTPELPQPEDRSSPDDQIIRGVIARKDTTGRKAREKIWLYQRLGTISLAVKDVVRKELDKVIRTKPNIPRELQPLAESINPKDRTPLLKTAQKNEQARSQLEMLRKMTATADDDFRPSEALVMRLKNNARLTPEAAQARTHLTNAALTLIVNWVDHLFPSAGRDFRLEAIQQAYVAALNSWDAIPKTRNHDPYLSCAIVSSLYIWWKTEQLEGRHVPKMNPRVEEALPPLIRKKGGQTTLEEILPVGLRPKIQRTTKEEEKTALSPLPFDCLNPQQLLVITMRWGLTGKTYTLKEIAGYLGVSRNAVLQIEKGALEKIKRQLRRKAIAQEDNPTREPKKPITKPRAVLPKPKELVETGPLSSPDDEKPPSLPELVKQIAENHLPQEMTPSVVPLEKNALPYLSPPDEKTAVLYCSDALKELVRVAWGNGVFLVIVGGAVRNLLQGNWGNCDLDIQAYSLDPKIPLQNTRALLVRLPLPSLTTRIISRYVEETRIISGLPSLQLTVLPHPDTQNDPWPWLRLSPSCRNFAALVRNTFAELVVVGEEWGHDFFRWASHQPSENSAGVVLIPNGNQIEAFLIDFFGARSALSEKGTMRFNAPPITIKGDLPSILKAATHLLWLQKTAQQLGKELPKETLELTEEIAEEAKKLRVPAKDKTPFTDFMTKTCRTLTKMFAWDFSRLREKLYGKSLLGERFEIPRGSALLRELPTLNFLLGPYGRKLFPRFAELLESEVAPHTSVFDLLLLTSLDLWNDYPDLQPQKLSETLETPPTPDDLPVVAGLKEPWLFFPSFLLWLENMATVKVLKEVSKDPEAIREFVVKIPRKNLRVPRLNSQAQKILHFMIDFEDPRGKTPKRLNTHFNSPHITAEILYQYIRKILASAFSPVEVNEPDLPGPEAPFIIRAVDEG